MPTKHATTIPSVSPSISPTVLEIPELDEAELQRRLARVRPVVRDEGTLWWIKPVDCRRVAFTWDPEFVARAEGLRPVKTIRTLHRWSYYGSFKPSIAEVLAQIPAEDVERVVAFEVSGPTHADDLNRESEALDVGFHVSATTLYAQE